MNEIDRIPCDTPFSRFLEEFFLPNRPGILTEVSTTWPANAKWTREYLLAALRRHQVAVNKLWFSVNDRFLRDDYDVPEIVRRCLDPAWSHTREHNVRIWINDENHLTPFHSDTNGLYVFNLQIAGSKRWQLIDPDAPIDLYAFSQFPHLRYNARLPDAVARYAWDCRLKAGEMLFVPAFWYHKVVSESETVNLNWVGTKRRQPDNRLHRREREILKAALALRRLPGLERATDLLVGTNEPDYLRRYAGTGGIEFVRSLAAGATIPAAIRRLAVEMAALPALVRDLPRIRRYQENPLDVLAKAGAS